MNELTRRGFLLGTAGVAVAAAVPFAARAPKHKPNIFTTDVPSFTPPEHISFSATGRLVYRGRLLGNAPAGEPSFRSVS